jgi:hypothetical protein
MRLVAVAVCAAAVAAPVSFAKGTISVTLGDGRPHVGQPFTVYVRTGYRVGEDDWLRLIAVAPGKDWYDVVRTVTGSRQPHAAIPRDGFEIKLVRSGQYTWRAVVRLPRVGRWRLVVPNGTHSGFMMPPPAAWMPWVQVRA